LAVFFTVLGLDLPVQLVLHNWWMVLLLLVAALTLKTLITAATSWALGATAAVAVYVGLGLAQGGEFSLVLLRQAKSSGVLTPDQAGYGIAMVVLSLVLTP